VDFFATNRLNKSINNLLSKTKNYGCILNHLFNAFNNKSDDDLFENGYRLNGNHPIARMLKLRVQSCGGNAKSEGFRVIVFVNKNTNKFYFLDIYPKKGPLAKSNMKKDERKNCLIELNEEKEKLYIIDFDTKKELIIIKKP